MTVTDLLALDVSSSPGSLIEAPGQLEWRGLLLGEGTFYCTDTLDGWESLPGVDRSAVSKARQHGGYPGTTLAQERIVNWTGAIFIDGNSTHDARAALLAAMYLRDDAVEEPLVIRTDGVSQLAWAQLINRGIPLSANYRRWVENVQLQWACSDPRRYTLPTDGSLAFSRSIGLPSAGGGLVYPITYPLDWGDPGDSGSGAIENTGPVPTPGVYTIRGVAGSPQIVIVQPDGTRLATTFDVDLAAGEELRVDAREGTVLLEGTASRAGSATGTPVTSLLLAPGVNQVSFRAASGDPATAGLDVAWLPADM